MATQLYRPARDLGPKVEYLRPEEMPDRSPDDVKTVYILREKVIERHHTGWGFDAFNEFMNKALATFAVLCIAGVGLAMLILALAVLSHF